MNKKVIESLAKLLNFDVKVLTKAIETEGEVIDIPEGSRFLSSTELETIKDNHGRTRYDVGKTAGSEMLLKDLSEKIGLDVAVKDADKFISTYKANILTEANLEPNAKVKELETSLSNLQKQIGDKDKAYETLQNSIESEKRVLKAQSFIPELAESLGLKKSEAANIILGGVEVKDDGVYKDGVILKDNMEKPISLEDYMKDSVTKRGWDKTPSGRGGGSGSGGDGGNTSLPKTMQEFEDHLKEKGYHAGSAEAQSLLVEAAKETPELLG